MPKSHLFITRLAVVGVSLGLISAPTPAFAASWATAPLVAETFRDATADPRFQGYGSACLTGAAAGTSGPLDSCETHQGGPVPPIDGAPYGFLQLTDASNDQSGAVLFDQPIPSNEGVQVTFDQYQYGSTTPIADADGISFFLVDGAGGLTEPGAFGGSLGYAQKLPNDDPSQPFLPGVDNGYLGVGLDVLGNYFGDWEQRGNGCAERSPAGTGFHVPGPGQNMVTVRGPGDGVDGYCFLTATTSNFTTTGPWPSTLPGDLQGPLTTMPPGVTPQEADTLLRDSARTVTVAVSPAPSPQVTVDIDFHDGNGTQRVLDFAAPEPVPDSYKFGFAASTGLFTDVHLIGNLSVRTERPLPVLGLEKSADTSRTYRVGDVIDYTYNVTNESGVTIEDIEIDDDRVRDIECDSTSLAPIGEPGDSTTCHGEYTVTASDGKDGEVVNHAIASGQGGAVLSPEATVTVKTAADPKPHPKPQPKPKPVLPVTGGDVTTFALLGVVLTALGAIGLFVGRRLRS